LPPSEEPSVPGGGGAARGRRGRPARSEEVQPLASVLDGLLVDRPWVGGMALGRLAASWVDVVGDRLAEECTPAALEHGTLLVRASSAPWGAQVRFLAEVVGERANAVLGGDVVREVRVVVAAP
jgi:predicted nucleic acid-binding Zn ribbon protein